MTTLTTVPRDIAANWLRRWDAQQEGTIPDREERFTVLCDVLEIGLAEVAEPVILDLGCGPGSLAGRLHERLPRAQIIGIDSDPLLLGLAESHYGNAATWVDADLGGVSWHAHVPETVHASVSTTALHWMQPTRLGELYRTLGALTAPGGLLVNGDHLGLGDARIGLLAHQIRQRRAARTRASTHEGWDQWWQGALADPALAELGAARAAKANGETGKATGKHSHIHHGNGLSVPEHTKLLRAAGFTSVDPVWQFGDDHVLVAVK